MKEYSLYPFQFLDVRLFNTNISRFNKQEQENVDENHETPENRELPLAIKIETLRQGDRNVTVHLNIDIEGPDSESPQYNINFTLEGMFISEEDLDNIDEKIWEDFENRSALSLLWPYAREYLHNITFRMREFIPLLPTLNLLNLQNQNSSS
jgi:preprotein translocase subunit SecB